MYFFAFILSFTFFDVKEVKKNEKKEYFKKIFLTLKNEVYRNTKIK
jgi:hypothetical protein